MRFTFLAVLCAGLFSPLAALPKDLSGAWVLHADWGPKLRYDLLCDLKQDGQSLSGPCGVVYGYVERASGSIGSEAMDLEYTTTYQGNEVHVTYQGKRQSDGWVRGQVTAGFFNGDFDAAPLAAPPGAWQFHVSLGNAPDFQLLCAFKASENVLRGPCAPVVGSVLQASGTADDKGVALAYDTELNGAPIHVMYTGAVQPDGSIKGEASGGAFKGVFTAKRR
ncbi:MAG TPA: hypothetical protein VGS12_16645 [Caulobacteraceae bacterium]|nr:hypothetical protein [Caulobacteraceae bacterium]